MSGRLRFISAFSLSLQVKEKKTYTPFPPVQQPSKIDLQLESGEYFLSQEQKVQRARAAQQEKQVQRVEENKRKREAAFIAPKEQASTKVAKGDGQQDVKHLADALKKKGSTAGQPGTAASGRHRDDVSEFLMPDARNESSKRRREDKQRRKSGEKKEKRDKKEKKRPKAADLDDDE